MLVVKESSETDNSYTKTITVQAAPKPNLTPYQPGGWSNKIVVSKAAGTTTDATPLYSTDDLYVNWALINNGAAAITNLFYSKLYIDGILKSTWNTPSLPAGNWAYASDYLIGKLSRGTHTLRIVTDATGVVAESSETDNSFTRSITVY